MIYLMGMPATGKDSIKDKLREQYGYKVILPYTTRPTRDNENDGDNYHHISKREFFRLKVMGFFVATSSYKVANGEVWYYGIAKEDFGQEHSVVVGNPDWLKKWKRYSKKTRKDLFAVMITANEDVIATRMICRNDKMAEIKRRIEKDNLYYESFSDKVDFCIDNSGTRTLLGIASIINIKYYDFVKKEI